MIKPSSPPRNKCKICLLGDVGVGKTSVVTRVVHGGFSADYLTTVGVKIDTHQVALPQGQSLKMVIWDIAGTDALSSIDHAYTRGAGGYCVVADGTRPASLAVALDLREQLEHRMGALPFVALLNKRDLFGDDLEAVARPWKEAGLTYVTTSALTGENVAFAFEHLAMQILTP